MSWTVDQLLAHPKRNDLLGVNIKSKQQATEISGDSEKTAVTAPPQTPVAVPASSAHEIRFIVVGDPMGKPRMTRRDVWKKRPVVLRYHDYCDRIKEATPNAATQVDVYAVDVTAYIAMPPSWSKKKQEIHAGQMHRARPDWDNIGKAVCDALYAEDAKIAEGRTRKFWCREGEQRTEIILRYLP